VAVIPRLSVANTDKSEGDIRTVGQRSYRFDNRAVYAGQERVELELYQLHETAVTGADSDLEARRLELRQRVVYRPIFISPITLRYNYGHKKSRNDQQIAPGAPDFNRVVSNEVWLEWLMRWTRLFSTQLREVYSHDRTRDLAAEKNEKIDESVLSFIQKRVGTEAIVRVHPTDGTLSLIQMNRVYYLFGSGLGAAKAVAYDIGVSVIWMIKQMLYLDSEVTFRQTHCIGGACSDQATLEPRMLLTFNM
jgi:hypothetical protein